MPAAEVTQALTDWEQRLRGLGARGMPQLRPGLSAAQIDAISNEFGVQLPEDAVAIWAWHDGEQVAAGSTALAPYREFHPLREALNLSRTWTQDAVARGFAEDEAFAHVIFRAELVPVLGYQLPLVLDCTDPHATSTTTVVWTPDGGLQDMPHLTMVERITWWHWALDHGAWSISPDGAWNVDFTRYPGAGGDLSVKDVLS
ncbi:SMI1/KNR4 family protein [Cellulomonas chengniuliangii]|uniref:SMI1/KNR4 family protein n=1 Tax=Cellulomonas chengniuliangii TaxID=2968084 RepID=A0ABY5KZQ1_9CELL|nr:SMI1/KNR4 family protein [Cellulomonas chengniuliangii]MCC2307193.1 SMI1/KNR4 family protein [Cellulomonas chengniuliangii]UUI76010.1 SMI1/KNR4 family protein [Cellulomonas chengniuliangii]